MCIMIVSWAPKPVLWFGLDERVEGSLPVYQPLSTVHHPPSEGRRHVHWDQVTELGTRCLRQGGFPGAGDKQCPVRVRQTGLRHKAPGRGGQGPAVAGLAGCPVEDTTGTRRGWHTVLLWGHPPLCWDQGLRLGVDIKHTRQKGHQPTPVSAASPTERQLRGTQPSALPTPALWWPKA